MVCYVIESLMNDVDENVMRVWESNFGDESERRFK